MSLFRSRGQEAANTAVLRSEAERQAKLAASLAFRDATDTITKDSLGLGNVDNTNDLSKPVSSAAQTALNLKASLVTIPVIATDADATYTATWSRAVIFHTGTLTAGRLITLTTAGIPSGWTARFTRTGSGAFNLSIGGLKNLTTNTWCDVAYNGSAWVLTAAGSL